MLSRWASRWVTTCETRTASALLGGATSWGDDLRAEVDDAFRTAVVLSPSPRESLDVEDRVVPTVWASVPPPTTHRGGGAGAWTAALTSLGRQRWVVALDDLDLLEVDEVD